MLSVQLSYPGFVVKMLSLCMAILTLVFISGVYMETCPEEEDIYPCKCKVENGYNTVECTATVFNNVENWLQLKVLQQAVSSLRGKKVNFIFKKFNMSIPPKFFSGIFISDLEFDSCRVDNLTKDDQPGLLGLENHLEWLTINRSLTVPPKLNLGHLKKLRKIKLLENNMTELRDDWLSSDLPSLEDLVIQKNNLRRIGSKAFSQLTNLEVLYLEDNRFGRVKRSMFPTTADKLRYLSLENNALTDLPGDLFRGMPSIIRVYLERNEIMTLDERTWSPVWQQLMYLNLRGNKIVCDDRLNWILKSEKRPNIFVGTCSAPKAFDGMDLLTWMDILMDLSSNTEVGETFLQFSPDFDTNPTF